MSIDWSTVIFQMLNFFILVFILKKHLFKPVVNAMDEREKSIQEKLNVSEKAKEEAEKELKKYERMLEDLKKKETDIMRNAHKVAEVEKQSLHKELLAEIKGKRAQFESQIKAERKMLQNTVRKLVGKVLVGESKNAFKELADVNLEEKVAVKFAEKISDLKSAEKKQFIKSYEDNGKEIKVYSSFDINKDIEKQIAKSLESLMGAKPAKLSFKEDSSIICGVEARLGTFVVSFGFNDYVTKFENELDIALAEITSSDDD